MLRLKARFSTLLRKSESSCSVANGVVSGLSSVLVMVSAHDPVSACPPGYLRVSKKIIALPTIKQRNTANRLPPNLVACTALAATSGQESGAMS